MKTLHRNALIVCAVCLLISACAAGCLQPGSSGSGTTGSGQGGGSASGYAVVDTGQYTCYDNNMAIACPLPGEAFFGQDACNAGKAPDYRDNGDGTVTDKVTGLMWQKSPDLSGDGKIDVADKLTLDGAKAKAGTLRVGGYSDWRLPTIKELYSLIDFSGLDPSGYQGTDTSGLIPFLDDGYFPFGYGDTLAGERIIDAQYVSSTEYTGTVMGGQLAVFGVNFADGRIKGYPPNKLFYVKYVRGNTDYGKNDFTDNQDGTVTDEATGLIWSQNDSGESMNWQAALAWVEQKNAEGYLGHDDWRLPNVKELQSIVDYSRSPDATASAAIDPIFHITSIVNEAGEDDFPCFWTGTTHANLSPVPGANAAYVAFGRAMGYMFGGWMDVHGAGAQRSDPKAGSAADWPYGHGPQGDAIRINNFVRLVRGAE
ncbi:MAG: DUF1566 domain-containing protein [Thermodesulfobacteriota bacterium]